MFDVTTESPVHGSTDDEKDWKCDVIADLYPATDSYDHGMLDVGGNRVYCEACRNSDGKPALVVHSGPEIGCSLCYRRYFDPDRYRVILVDQRGCGRGTPPASDRATHTRYNTIEHLLAGSGIISLLSILIFSVIATAIGGGITAVIYNLLAKWVGGVELDLSGSLAPRQSHPTTTDHSGHE